MKHLLLAPLASLSLFLTFTISSIALEERADEIVYEIFGVKLGAAAHNIEKYWNEYGAEKIVKKDITKKGMLRRVERIEVIDAAKADSSIIKLTYTTESGVIYQIAAVIKSDLGAYLLDEMHKRATSYTPGRDVAEKYIFRGVFKFFDYLITVSQLQNENYMLSIIYENHYKIKYNKETEEERLRREKRLRDLKGLR